MEEETSADELLQTEVTSASLKIDEVGPYFNRCKKKQKTSGPLRLITSQEDLENGVTVLLMTIFIIFIELEWSFTNVSEGTLPKHPCTVLSCTVKTINNPDSGSGDVMYGC